MSIDITDFAPECYGPDHKLLEALIKDSEEEWMKIIREGRNETIGSTVCPLICVLKRWTAALSMIADFRRSFFKHFLSCEKSVLYRYIRNDAFVVSVERKWPKLSYSAIALITAVREGYIEGVRAILKFVAFPNLRDLTGRSMLLEAVASRNIETVRAFLDYGLRDQFVTDSDTTAAAQAAQLGELKMMREIGWSTNDDIVLERGVRGGNMEVVKTIVAARTEKFNLEHISRLTKDESLRELLSEANAALPEGIPTSKTSRWKWLFAKLKQSNATSKNQMDASTSGEKSRWQ